MNKWLRRCEYIVLLGLLLICFTGCNEDKERTAKKEVFKAIAQDEIPKFTKNTIQGIQVEKDGDIIYRLKYNPREDRESFLYWDLEEPYKSYVTVNSENMYHMFETFSGIDWEKAKEDNKSEETGIEETSTKITVDYKDKENKEAVILVGNKNAQDEYYCALESNKKRVVLIKTYLIDTVLNRSPFELILKIPYLLDVRSVKGVDISFDDKKISMTSSDGKYQINKKDVSDKEYKDQYITLFQPLITGEIPESNKESLKGKKKITLNFKRTKKDFEDYHVSFYEYDDKNDYVKVNDTTFFLVEKAEVDSMIKSLQ